MNALDRVRERYGSPEKKSENLGMGTPKAPKSPSGGFVGASPRDSEVFSAPIDFEKYQASVEARERRRAKVLGVLRANPQLRFAWLIDESTDPATLTVAIRGIGSAELSIETDHADPFKLLETFQKAERCS